MKLKYILAATMTSALCLGTAMAQQDFSTYKPNFNAVKIATSEAPTIDGNLDDAIWQRITPDENFYQVLPSEGTPSERTTMRVAYDENTLYVAIYNYDQTPEDISISSIKRDPNMGAQDANMILLDPFQTGRDSYLFGVNAMGAKLDALIEGNSTFQGNWDTIWDAAAQKTDQGWVAEFAIPFRSVAFDPSSDDWNMNIVRNIPRKNEQIRWSYIDRTTWYAEMSNAGTLGGIEGAKPGGKVEAQVFATATASRQWEDQTHQGHDDEVTFNPSGNLFYKFTPSLTGTLTVNTDFSDSGLDSRQVNTGRFSLFFPETREFFLQDSASFAFAGRSFVQWTPNGLPFFSRRIGIVDGAPTDIIAGAKISGEHMGFNVGGLVAVTDDVHVDGTDYDGQTLGVMRVSRALGDKHKLGMLVTAGDPTGEEDAVTYGIDYSYNNTDFLGGRLHWDLAAVHTDNEFDSGTSLSNFLAYRSDSWNATVRARRIEEGYDPKLGFASRRDIDMINTNLSHRWHFEDNMLNNVQLGIWTLHIESIEDGNFQDQLLGNWANFSFANGDNLNLEQQHGKTRIDDDFDLAGEVLVPAGSYHDHSYYLNYRRADHNTWSGGVFAYTGEEYGGDKYGGNVRLKYNPNPYFSVGGSVGLDHYDLPNGEIDIVVGTIENEINITPDLNIETEIQYDNISENMAWLTQVRWQYKPETEIFTSFGHTADMDEDDFPRDFTSTSTALSLRVGHRFRF